MPGQGMNSFSHRPNNNKDRVVEDQKPLVLCVYDSGPFNWVGFNMKYVFAMIVSTSRQIFPRMNWNGNSGVTRANVPQTSLVLNSGATIHFFSNQELLQAIKKSNNSMTIHCGGSTFDQAMIGRLHNELKHLPFLKEKCVLPKMALQIYYPLES